MADDPVVREIEIRAPAARVYEMFTDPEMLVRWIGIRALLEPRPVGAIPVEPGSSTVEVDLDERDGVTHLRLTHRGLDGAVRPLHDDGWSRFLPQLKSATEGSP